MKNTWDASNFESSVDAHLQEPPLSSKAFVVAQIWKILECNNL